MKCFIFCIISISNPCLQKKAFLWINTTVTELAISCDYFTILGLGRAYPPSTYSCCHIQAPTKPSSSADVPSPPHSCDAPAFQVVHKLCVQQFHLSIMVPLLKLLSSLHLDLGIKLHSSLLSVLRRFCFVPSVWRSVTLPHPLLLQIVCH